MATILHNSIVEPREKQRDSRRGRFSKVDRKIIQTLLVSSGRVTSAELQKMTGLPQTTMQRRRKKLEAQFIKLSYDLDLNMMGLQKVNLIVAVHGNVNPNTAADYLLGLPFVSRVSRIFGGTNHDLLVEAVVEQNGISSISDMIDMIRRTENVRDVQWFMNIQEIGKNADAMMRIIDPEYK
jgi:DNA-binding Lrp family transcriptional regulator